LGAIGAEELRATSQSRCNIGIFMDNIVKILEEIGWKKSQMEKDFSFDF
jgi:hypothetical protein